MAISRLRKKTIICAAAFLFFAMKGFSQISPGCDLKFIGHLIKISSFREALFLLNSGNCLEFQANDSASFFRGAALFYLDSLDTSANNFLKVNPSSSFYPESHFRAGYNFTHTGNYSRALEILGKIEPAGNQLAALRNYQFAGINLLSGNMPEFNEWFNKIDTASHELSGPVRKLNEVSKEILNHKSKSPFVAGMMSGVIPGSGKLYAGKKGEALSTFLTTVGFGLVTWESYRKTGLNSFRTIAFGSLFAISYAANIYGSVFSVRIIENDYNEHVKSTILFNLHLSIGNTFSR